jgi:hypothetical protein
MTPLRRRDLVVLAAGLAVAVWLLVRTWYGELPGFDWWLPAPLAVLAVAEAVAARVLTVRLGALREARSGRGPVAARSVRPVEPMLVARLAVLAQASAYVGAVFTGVWLGLLAHVGPAVGRLQDAGNDSVTAIIGIVVSIALVVAALWLESACRVPPEDPDPSAEGRVSR